MRHLSFAFAFVITLLFGHVVIALTPTGSRTGEEDTSLTLAHLPTPPERRVPGRIVRRASGGNHPPVVPTVGSLVRVPVGAHQTKDSSNKKLPKKTRGKEHEAVVTSVKANPHDPNNPHIGLAVITHSPGKNPDFVPEAAGRYVNGPDQRSKIHVGPSFEVLHSQTKPSRKPRWKVHDLPGLLNKINTNTNGQSTSGQQHGGGAARKPAQPTPPNSGAQRGRNPNPPKQGGKRSRGSSSSGGGGKRRKVGSGGKV